MPRLQQVVEGARQANGKFADAVLGEFAPVTKRYVAAVEGKGPKDPLDRPFAGRKVSAVDQAYDYAINLRCPWILVTNIRQTRLYYKGADKQTYERFDTEALAADDRQLKKFVTRYIVEQALGGVLRDRFERLRRDHFEKAKGTARGALADPRAYDLDALKAPKKQALLEFWQDWQLALGSIRIPDPACGSGAFLIEAFDQLHAEYQQTNDRVQELRGYPELFDLDRKILQDNPATTRVCAIPREQLRVDDLSVQIAKEGVEVPRSRLTAEAWSLQPQSVNGLLEKIRSGGVPLAEFAGVKPQMGIKTGFNNAFLIDDKARQSILRDDPAAEPLIRPFLRGQDIRRWSPEWAGLWMIAIKSSGDHPWPWAGAGDRAEEVFRESYPGLHAHLKPFEDALRKRQDRGRFWWELRACAYWAEFDKPKLIYQEIQYHPWYGLDRSGSLGNNKTFFVASGDLYLLAVLNSPLMWWHNFRCLPHMKDEALTPVAFLIEKLPIAAPSDEACAAAEHAVGRLIEITESQGSTSRDLLDWLRVEHAIDEPSQRLRSAPDLDSESFVTEIRKLRGKKNPLSLAALRSLREEHTRTILPAQALAREAQALERRISDLVNEAYGLTPEEVELMWETAPPRMPIARP